ncbi:hypothetical protein LTR28_004413 [Elasticomyces elasticus]|nr:hypothetical protein LTR28_004413 [Elasticomyces elasticus]
MVAKSMAEDIGFRAALEEAQKGASEGGVPIGACLVSAEGKIMGRGHNMRVQKSSATLHIKRVVLGENNTFVGGEDYLKKRGIEVVNLQNAVCEELMKTFIKEHPEDWYEDIGEQ